ncbi:MAG: hypothetical protein AAFV07_04700 [Bacteroidota bacterium]
MPKFISLLLLLFISALQAQELPPYIELEPFGTVEVYGDLYEGYPLDHLSWAWNSSVACFTQLQESQFSGSHVTYYTDIPAYSQLEIKVIPDSADANFSLYAYQVGRVDASNMVPNLKRCIRCEADYKRSAPVRGRVEDHTRTVRDLLAVNRPYQCVIVVVGAEGLMEGGFTLLVSHSPY